MGQKEYRKTEPRRQGIAQPAVIFVITLAALAVLALLLLFSRQFVGKAIEIQPLSEGEGGFPVDQQAANSLKVGDSAKFDVKVNIDGESSVVSFELSYDPEKLSADCSNIYDSLDSIFTGQDFNLAVLKEHTCADGQITFSYAALPDQQHLITGEQTLAEITFTALDSPGPTQLLFDPNLFKVYNLDPMGPETFGLILKGLNLEIVSAESVEEIVCVDSDGGQNYNVKGTLNGFLSGGDPAEVTDYCHDGDPVNNLDASTHVSEYLCLSDNIHFTRVNFECANGCQDGACVVVTPICGDGTIDTNEQCDDGNTATEACAYGQTSCMVCGASCTQVAGETSYLGDGTIDATEQCDDSNTMSGDGCSSTGQIESGYTCTGTPSVCQTTTTTEETTEEQALTTTGTKITLTDVATANDVFSTKITATESFNEEIIIYTVLYGPSNKVLSIKSEKVEAGLANGAAYTAAVNYPAANVKSKSVIVYDVEQNPSVFGQLQKSYQ
ncbi:hypothetical protein HYU08_03645 [Candidatus Woesearchaeota archaeon]|nr:hypothetical protein [Candidatus Woesearchaeota archaeon]